MFKNYKYFIFPDLVIYNDEVCVFVDLIEDEQGPMVLLARESGYYCPVLEDNTQFELAPPGKFPDYIYKVIEREAARRWWASPEGKDAQGRRAAKLDSVSDYNKPIVMDLD